MQQFSQQLEFAALLLAVMAHHMIQLKYNKLPASRQFAIFKPYRMAELLQIDKNLTKNQEKP
jgi:hypothetical protein